MAIIKTDLIYNGKRIGGYISSESLDAIFAVNSGHLRDFFVNEFKSTNFTYESVTLYYNHMAEMKVVTKHDDQTKDYVFALPGLKEKDVTKKYDLSFNEEDFDTDPFTLSFASQEAALGALEATIDFLANLNGEKSPTAILRTKRHEERENTQKFLVLLLSTAGLLHYKRTSENMRYIKQINELTKFTEDIVSMGYVEATRAIMSYDITRAAFIDTKKITALKYYRRKSKKSQIDIANELGISLRQYQRYESNSTSLSSANKLIIEKLAELFNISEADLVEDGEVVLKKQI